MLVEEKDRAELVAYLSAAEGQSGFIIPIFRQGRSNALLIQQVELDDRVSGFKTVDPRDLYFVQNQASQFQSIGDSATWGFVFQNREPFFAERQKLQEHLRSFIDVIDQPFLKLQVTQFCESDANLIEAWREAFRYLEKRSPRSAYAWRDVVVIPAQMRLAIEHIIIAQGLRASTSRLDQEISVDIQGREMRLLVEKSLYESIQNDDPSRLMLESSIAPISKAFDLSIKFVPLSRAQVDPEKDIIDDKWRDTLIAAVGKHSIALISHVLPTLKAPVRNRYLHSSSDFDDTRTLIVENGIPTASYTDASADLFDTKKGSYRLFVILFQLGSEGQANFDNIAGYIRSYKPYSKRVCAIITGIPDLIDQQSIDELFDVAKRYFDVVWILSDRSTYALQTLPYGPSRSSSAAASHFDYLIKNVLLNNDLNSAPIRATGQFKFSLISSAIGERSIEKLVSYCMMRMTHHTFNISDATIARVDIRNVEKSEDLSVRNTIEKHITKANILVNFVKNYSEMPPHSTVMLSGVTLRPSSSSNFQSFCTHEFKRHGWKVSKNTLTGGELSISHRELEDLRLSFRFVSADDSDTILHSYKKRQHLSDSIVLTNAMIRRRSFAIHVLNGQVPIHCSRIEAMHRIYRRRYAYVITYMQKEQRKLNKILQMAALDFVNCYCLTKRAPVFEDFGKVRFRNSEAMDVNIQAGYIFLSLNLMWVKGNAKRSEQYFGWAELSLSEHGWSIKNLSFQGRSLNDDEQAS